MHSPWEGSSFPINGSGDHARCKITLSLKTDQSPVAAAAASQSPVLDAQLDNRLLRPDTRFNTDLMRSAAPPHFPSAHIGPRFGGQIFGLDNEVARPIQQRHRAIPLEHSFQINSSLYGHTLRDNFRVKASSHSFWQWKNTFVLWQPQTPTAKLEFIHLLHTGISRIETMQLRGRNSDELTHFQVCKSN